MTASIKNFDRVADRIRQHRQADTRPIIVVEGPSDYRFLRAGFDEEYALFPANTRSIALEVTEQLTEWRLTNVACVVDRDFDGEVKDKEAVGVPVFAYENADLEAMLSHMDAFSVMISEIGSEKKIKGLGGPARLAELVSATAIPVARLRAANCQNGWGLAFDEVDLASKIALNDLTFNLRGYCTALRQKSPDSPPLATLIAVAEGLDPTVIESSCPRHSSPYYRGRDFLAVLGVALRQQAGSCQKAATDPEHLAGILRATGCKAIKGSSWGKDLQRFMGDTSAPKKAKIPRPR
ncbi:hypothetical protein AB0M79_29950 [Polymorphospora sp. NPDC051019]|uniref:hypothetical protein n=1 Tax=Polymorphospora sp. NPDC051019 TaxID=3155725 RepID=UPI00342E267F